MVDLGEGPGGGSPPLFWLKHKEMIEVKKASRANKSRLDFPPPLLAQGLDLSLGSHKST